MDSSKEKYVWKFDNTLIYQSLVGPLNVNLKMLMMEIDDQILEHSIDNTICLSTVNGNNDEVLVKFLQIYTELYNLKVNLEMRDLMYLINVIKLNDNFDLPSMIKFYTNKQILLSTSTGKKIGRICCNCSRINYFCKVPQCKNKTAVLSSFQKTGRT